MAEEIEPHMSWCVGAHDDDGACFVEETVADVTVGVAGLPGDNVCMYVAGAGYDQVWNDDADDFLAIVTEMRQLLAASQVETTWEWLEEHYPERA